MTHTDDPTVDDRIRRALSARAETLTEADLRPDVVPASGAIAAAATRRRWAAPLLAAAAVAAIAVGTFVAVDSNRSGHVSPARPPAPGPSLPIGPPSGRPAPSVTPAPSVSPAPPSSAPTAAAPPVQGSSAPPAAQPPFELGFAPLWPFGAYAEVQQWQVSGSQPWHADADSTALVFTSGYLGFTDIDRITSRTFGADGAHIGVGYLNPNGRSTTAAVLHLVRYGPEATAPWEVVGTDDSAAFAVDEPPYGSAVTSPMTVGGRVIGVDESIRVTVRQLGSTAAVGQRCCVPAGSAPWSTTVTFTGSGVLTVVASTGGHLRAVERFAIQAVRG